jgi:hypothetical protein
MALNRFQALAASAVMAGIFGIAVAGWNRDGVFGSNPLDRLVLKLQNEGYTRGLDKNAFSLDYRVRHPDTVIVVVRTTPKADTLEVKTLINNARELIQGVGRDQFQLDDIRVEVDQKPLTGS